MRTLRLISLLLFLLPTLALASVDAQAGPYRIRLSTQPGVIPVGQAKVVLRITDASGKPLEDLEVRAIARMPGMFMGEREQRANATPGEPGSYAMQAAFPMAGAYEVAVQIAGGPGEAATTISVRTGQDTGEGKGGFSWISLIPWGAGFALLVFVVVRMRSAGERVDWRSVFNRGTIGGVLVLGAMLFGSMYAVNNLRRDGAMTPIEAQVMEMNTPAPPGTTAVELASVKRESISQTVRYAGQAVGYVEQDVNARGTGVIVWMPYYVGDRVKKGQILARLDTSQLDPQLAERAAMSNMAAESVGVAAMEYQTALEEVAEARAEVSAREGMVAEAEAMIDTAKQSKSAMEAELAAAETEIGAAEAEVAATEQVAKFREDELRRNRELFEKGAISRSELQQSESESAEAQSKLRQAQSMVRQAKAMVDAARANVRKGESEIIAAEKKAAQARADVRAAEASVSARQSAAEAAKRNISKERAGVDQARAGYNSAAAERGYSALKAEVDGVITQRLISPGVLVNPGQSVLKIAQISPIRLQANVASADLEKVSVGTRVTILLKDKPIEARISSISPAVDVQARTGVIEAVLPNDDARFLPGQFVEMQIETGGRSNALTVPREAIQRPPGEPGSPKAFVWVADPTANSGSFTVRRVEVQLGATSDARVAVVGLSVGQMVVTRGATNLREGSEVTSSVEPVASKGPVVEVLTSGFKPDTITVEAGKPVTITYIRRTDQTCGTEVVFKDLGINKPLPLNQPVEVTFTPEKPGELKFACAMDMVIGKVVVR